MSGKKKRSEVQPLAAVVILCLSVKNAVQDVSYDKGSCLQLLGNHQMRFEVETFKMSDSLLYQNAN